MPSELQLLHSSGTQSDTTTRTTTKNDRKNRMCQKKMFSFAGFIADCSYMH